MSSRRSRRSRSPPREPKPESQNSRVATFRNFFTADFNSCAHPTAQHLHNPRVGTRTRARLTDRPTDAVETRTIDSVDQVRALSARTNGVESYQQMEAIYMV
jgi:hypothetical protein